MTNNLNSIIRLRLIAVLLFTYASAGNAVIDIDIRGSTMSFTGPYYNISMGDAPFPCPYNTWTNSQAVWCLSNTYREVIPNVSYISPDDQINKLSGKSCKISMGLRTLSINLEGTSSTIYEQGRWRELGSNAGYVFRNFEFSSNNCVEDLMNISQWGKVKFTQFGFSRSNYGSYCANIYVESEGYYSGNLVKDFAPNACGHGGTVTPPESKPTCTIDIPREINHGVMGKNDSSKAFENIAITCSKYATLSMYFMASGTPISANSNGSLSLNLGSDVKSDICLQTNNESQCYGGNAPYNWKGTSGSILLSSVLTVGQSAKDGEYSGQTTLVVNVN